MDGHKVRSFIFCLVVGLYLSFSHPFYLSPALATNTLNNFDGVQTGPGAGDEDQEDDDGGDDGEFVVETEIGPEFKEGDGDHIEACTLAIFKNKFPFDFIQAPISEGRKECPKLTMFEVEHEACFIVDTFEKIEPGIIASLFILSIISL